MRAFHIESSMMIGIGALLAALGTWMQYGITETRKFTDLAPIYEKPQYLIEKFTITTSDGNGVSYILKGEELSHFSNGRTNISKPCVVLFDKQDSVRAFSADNAQIIKDGGRIRLDGNVKTVEHKHGDLSHPTDVCLTSLRHIEQKSTIENTDIELEPDFKVPGLNSSPSQI